MKQAALKFLIVSFSIASLFCSSSQLKRAYNADASLVAAYKVAAPLRSSVCGIPPQIKQSLCDSSLKMLKADYLLIRQYSDLLTRLIDSSDKGLEAQILALVPMVESTTTEILSLITELKQ